MASSAYVLYAESFNKNLKILALDLLRRFPNDPLIYRAHQRTVTVIAMSPLFVINQVGPYLYRYRDEIYNFGPDKEQFFLDNPFDSELKAGVKEEKVELVAYIIPRAKECARTLSPEEKESYRQLVVDLLDDYIFFLETAPKT